MKERVEVVGLIGGELMSNTDAKGKREAVLALPLSRLLVKMVRVPAEQTSDMEGFLTPILQAMSPYPDEPLTVGWEIVSENERETLVLAAALPESSADDIAEKLDAAKLNVTRVDAYVLGELRALWGQIGGAEGLGNGRRLVLLGAPVAENGDGAVPQGVELIVLDGDSPSVIRSVPAGADLRREVMLSLLEAEYFGGAKSITEIVTAGDVDASALATFAPVRAMTPVSVQDALDALAARAGDPAALDARPASWREVLDETRFKAKLVKNVAAAVGVWLLIMGVLVGVPMTYDSMADYQKGLSKHHRRAYEQVCETKNKVEIVRKYSDHTRGALEMMKAVSDRLPAGIELDSFDFKREDGIVISGRADTRDDAYDLKDALAALADADGNRVFGDVQLGKVSAAKGGQKFSLECRYASAEENE